MRRRALRRRYGRAAKKGSGWVLGRAPSKLELFSHGKPLALHKSGSQWSVSVLGAPVVKLPQGGLTFRGRVDFSEGMPVAKFSKGDAQHVAHKIGRYMFDLGDMAFGYVEGW